MPVEDIEYWKTEARINYAKALAQESLVKYQANVIKAQRDALKAREDFIDQLLDVIVELRQEKASTEL